MRGFSTSAPKEEDGLLMMIRQAIPADMEAMWAVFQAVIASGDTLPFDAEFDRQTFELHWLDIKSACVAIAESGLVAMYKLAPNYPGRGAHVANATYAVSPAAQGQGVGRALVAHSLAEAQRQGFSAMQFNYVVSTNTRAVRLYEKFGFTIVGTLPNAFRHRQWGLVDTHVMYRSLAIPAK